MCQQDADCKVFDVTAPHMCTQKVYRNGLLFGETYLQADALRQKIAADCKEGVIPGMPIVLCTMEKQADDSICDLDTKRCVGSFKE